jgi:omega-amidase
MDELKIALIQFDISWEETEKNLAMYARRIATEVHFPVDIIFLPEMFNTAFSINPSKCAEEMDGISIRFLKEIAHERNCTLVTSLLIREEPNFINRQVTVFPDGSVHHSDKRHLFRLSEEFKIFKGGRERKIVNVSSWNILPLVCFDLRFPVWSKNTYKDGNYGYDLLVYLSNWPESRSYVWKSLLVARAIENLSYVVGVNRVGNDGFGTKHSGDSMVVDPAGRIMISAEPWKETICELSLSKQKLGKFRETYPFGGDWDQFTVQP